MMHIMHYVVKFFQFCVVTPSSCNYPVVLETTDDVLFKQFTSTTSSPKIRPKTIFDTIEIYVSRRWIIPENDFL